ncbi:MAG: inorganic phosphate transporter [Kiloniellales bacterium]|nr:inorganic phosphate transporter [Kiloniellales bacterium]
MEITVLIFLSSGLFLGWSLGSNDAANIFGTAVGSRMILFGTAAVICAVFVVLGAVLGGAGAAHGLGKLGAVNALPGSFMVALAAAVTVYGMTKAGLPVSTTQAVVGGIIGWNLFGGFLTDMGSLSKIVGTWVICPVLGAIFAFLLYKATLAFLHWAKIHMVRLDALTRIALLVTGAFGAYSLGANNIGNVMGVFVSSSPFEDADIFGLFTLTSIQQLFLVGGLAIAVGVFYSKPVMMTVGNSIMPVSPIGAWVVVLAQSLVLFIFSSNELLSFVVSLGLPPYPLIPVSSSQAVIGAVIGIGLTYGLAGARQIKWRVLGNIGSGWVLTPVIAAAISFFFLFFLQNVFQQQVFKEVRYQLSGAVVEHLSQAGIAMDAFEELRDRQIVSAAAFRDALRDRAELEADDEARIIASAEIFRMAVNDEGLASLDRDYLGPERTADVEALAGQDFDHKWQLAEALSARSDSWQAKEASPLTKDFNKNLEEIYDYLFRHFQREAE